MFTENYVTLLNPLNFNAKTNIALISIISSITKITFSQFLDIIRVIRRLHKPNIQNSFLITNAEKTKSSDTIRSGSFHPKTRQQQAQHRVGEVT